MKPRRYCGAFAGVGWLLVLVSCWLGAAGLRAQQIETIFLPELTLTITQDPLVQQEVVLLRPGELVVPPMPSIEVIGLATENPALLVQRSALGLGWHVLRVEEEVLGALLELHGLAADQRSRMLRWERDEVRAGCYRRVLEIVNKPNRTATEQAVFGALAAAVKSTHVRATEESLRLYKEWERAPHLFVPPAPFKYSRPAPPNYGLFHLFGGPKPPSFDEFKQYGVAVVFGGAGGDGELQRVVKATARRSATVGLAVLGGGIVGAGAGVLLAAALPTAVTTLMTNLLIPFAVRTVSQGVASAAGVINGTVVGAIVFAVVTAVFEGIAVVDAAQLPGKLAEAVSNAKNMQVDLGELLTTEAGLAQLYIAYLDTTLPDFPATEQAPAAVATDQQWLTAAAGSVQYRPVAALQMRDAGGRPVSVRLLDGWFVVRDEAGTERMTLNLEYLGPQGQLQTLTKLANGFFCTDGTGNPGGCARVSEISFRNWSNETRLAKVGSGGVQAVIQPGMLEDGRVGVPFVRQLSVVSPGAGAYHYSLVADGAGMPPGLSLSGDGEVSGTPRAAGNYVFDVHATNPSGTHPAVQRVTLRIQGSPVIAPGNLANAWLFEDNAGDSVGSATGVWNGAAGYVAGWVGKAASFGGSSFIELPQNVFPAGARSFETWFRTTGAGVILGQIGVNTGYVPAVYVDTAGRLRVSFFWTGTLGPVTSAVAVNNGLWQHVAVTHDGVTQRVYLNGELISAVGAVQVQYATGYRYLLGYCQPGGWPGMNNGYFTGEIDEAAVYGRALGATEVAGIYAAGGAGKMNMSLGELGTSGVVGSYRRDVLAVTRNGVPVSGLTALRVVAGALPHGVSINAGDMTVAGTPRSVGVFAFTVRATDGTGHSGERSYTMTISGPARPRPDGMLDWWPGEGSLANRVSAFRPLSWASPSVALSYVPGLTGQSFGNLTYAVMPVFPSLGVSGITVETWFRTEVESVILARRGRTPGNASPVLWVGRDGLVRGDFSQLASPSLSRPLTGTVRVDDGGWHHAAISFGPGEQRVHVDGVLVGVGRGLAATTAVFGETFTLGGSDFFASEWPGLPEGMRANPSLPVAGLDEPALYGRVLETSEINGIFAAGSRGKPMLIVKETALPVVYAGIPYRESLSVQGASGALTWSIVGGRLPEGLRLSSGGIISGMLTSVRSSAVSIQVTDGTGALGVRDFVMKAQGTPAVLPGGLVAWWRGNQNPNDSWGTRHGIPTGSGPTYRTGNGGDAFFFNREGSSLALPAGSFPAMDTLFGVRTPYSFETWFMTDRPGVILGRRDFGWPMWSVVYKPALYVGTDGKLRAPMFEVERTGGVPVSSERVDDGKFHHVAVTYDGSSLRLYVDGVLQGPVIGNAVSRFGSLVDTVELGTGFTGLVGTTWPATYGGWMSFYGYIDEPATYGRALSEGEIRAITQAGEMGKANAPVVNVTLPGGRVGESYLVVAYGGPEAEVLFGGGEMPRGLKMSAAGILSGIPEVAGQHQFRCGVRQSNGVWMNYQYTVMVAGVAASPVGMAGWYSGEGNLLGHVAGETLAAPNGIGYGAGQVGQAFSFDGVSQHLVAGNVPFPAPGGEWSFESWFRTSAGGVILGQIDGFGNYVPMLYVGSEGRLCSAPYWGGAASVMTSVARVDDGMFHHAVFTYANGVRRLYLDGELVDTQTQAGVVYAAAYIFQIGSGTVANWPFAPANRYFAGQIDEVQFYNRALESGEARRGYTAGKLGRSVMVMDDTLADIMAGGGPYAGQITASGGVGPYAFAVTEGRLPVGVVMTSQGVLSGAVTHVSGTFDFAVEATAATGAKSIRDYRIVVNPGFRYRPAGVRAWWRGSGNGDDWTGRYGASAFSNVAGVPYGYGEGVAGQGFAFQGLGVGRNWVGFPVIYEGVVLPAGAFPAVGERAPFSLELWFRATQPGGLLGQSNQPMLLDYGLPMIYIDTAGRLRTQIGWASEPSQVVSPGSVLDDTWHHVAATLEAGGVMRVYLDGGLIGTRSGIGPVVENALHYFILGHVVATGWPLSGDSGSGVTFAGEIDELATWSRVLTQEEILRLVACGPNGKAERTITPGGELPAAVRNQPFTQALTVSGQSNARFVVAGGALPPGISVSTTESVNPPVSGFFGMPVSSGSWEFLLRNVPVGGPLASLEVVDERFVLTVDPTVAYRDWANGGGGLLGAARLPMAAPFGDSVNLLKYAFNLRAGERDTSVYAGGEGGMPRIGRDAAGRLVIEFLRRRAAVHPGLSYEVVTGADLGGLTRLSLDGAVVTPVDATWERVVVTDPVVAARRFGRVVVNQN